MIEEHIDVSSNNPHCCGKCPYKGSLTESYILTRSGLKYPFCKRYTLKLSEQLMFKADEAITERLKDCKLEFGVPNNTIDLPLTLDEIDDAIDIWHSSKSKDEVWEYLGLTWDEYKLYVENPAEFDEKILAPRRKKLNDAIVKKHL